MNKIQELALALIVIGIIIIAGYILYILVVESEIPFFIKIGIFVIILGILIALLSVIRDRVRELKKKK